MKLMPMLKRSLAGAVLLGCVLSGCAAAQHEATKPDAASPTSPTPSASETGRPGGRGTPYPLDSYRLSQSEAAIVTQAAEAVLDGCMKEHGFQAPPYVIASTVGETERRYGITDIALARTRGYHPGGTGADHRPTLPPSYDTAAYQAALGDATSGCLRTVSQKVGVGQTLADGDETVYRLDLEAFTQAQRSPAVRRSIATWSTCLRQHGITATDPLNAGAKFTQAVVTKSELNQATTDIQCKSAASLVAVWAAQEAIAQHAVITAHQADLNQIRATQLAVVRAARTSLQK
jgi:phosphopantetheinyl transferase (holo-ACP synthase)